MNLNPFTKDEAAPSQPSAPESYFMYTEDQLMARLRFFIGICLALTLVGIVFVVLYSIIFVTQPLNSISPIDQKFFEMLIPISTFLTGILSGIMLAGNDKDAKMKAIEAATARPTSPSSPGPMSPRPMGPVSSIAPTMSASPVVRPAPISPAVSTPSSEPILTARPPREDVDIQPDPEGTPRPNIRRPGV